MSRQVIKTNITTGLPDFRFLRGSHSTKTNVSPQLGASEWQFGPPGGRALPQIQLCIFRCRFGEADTSADETHWLSSTTKRFIEKSAEVW